MITGGDRIVTETGFEDNIEFNFYSDEAPYKELQSISIPKGDGEPECG